MHATVDIARYESREVRIAHCMLPAWDADEYVSISRASSIAISFTAQKKAIVQLESQRCEARSIAANSLGIAGSAPIRWLRVNEPSECLEVSACGSMRREIADELCVPNAHRLEDRYGISDSAASIAMARLRMLVRSANHDALEIESLARHLYARMLVASFGGRSRVRGDGGLSRQRLAHVVAWLDEHLTQHISIGDLARVAALTPAHFIRSFRRSTGLPPYQFVRLRRLERAREALMRGASVTAAAQAAHFSSISQFRTAYRNTFGYSVQQTPRRLKRIWIHPGASRP